MGVTSWITVGVILTFIGLLLLNTGTTAREGSCRRGAGWYLDARTPRETLVGRSAMPGPRAVPGWKILVWTGAAAVFAIGALASSILREVALGVLLGALGLALAGLAWDGRRRNRREAERLSREGEEQERRDVR